jgi:hypothetical protein
MKTIESSPPNVTFMMDLVGPRLAFQNGLVHHLAMIQLTQGSDESCWNLHENGGFYVMVDSKYILCISISSSQIC